MRDVPIAPICETVVRERAASSATRNWRGLALGALLSLAISIGGNEWAYSTLVPLLVTYVAKAVPIAGLIALTAVYQLYELPGVPRQLRNRLLFCLGVYAGILVLGSMFWFTTSPPPWLYVSLCQAILCGLAGCGIGRTPEAAVWTLRTMARVGAVVAVYKYAMPDVEMGASFPTLGVGWPVEVFILFGFCWYLCAALLAARVSMEMLLGAAACALEVFIAFHKPLVFAGIACMATLILLLQFLKAHRRRGNLRLLTACVVLSGTLFAAYEATGGRILEQYEEDFFLKYLHMSTSPDDLALDAGALHGFSGGRFDLWEQAMNQFWTSPLVGSGPGRRFFGEASGELVHAHNGYIEILYSIGILGALAHVAAAWIWLRRTVLTRGFRERARVTLPIAVYLGGFLFYESGEGATVLFTVLSFVYFLMGVAFGYSFSAGDASQKADMKPDRKLDRKTASQQAASLADAPLIQADVPAQ
jgi:O-antigen ligase